MKKLLSIFMLGLVLSGCNFVHKMDITQGNIIKPEMVKKLHIGMTRSQVQEVMGTPVLLNTFNENRVEYVYTFKPGSGQMTEKQLILTFRGGILRDISGNY